MPKIYEAPGKVEWVALVQLGPTWVKVHFTGGKSGGYGFAPRPATFTTDDPVVIEIIERSRYFSEGRIRKKEEWDVPLPPPKDPLPPERKDDAIPEKASQPKPEKA